MHSEKAIVRRIGFLNQLWMLRPMGLCVVLACIAAVYVICVPVGKVNAIASQELTFQGKIVNLTSGTNLVAGTPACVISGANNDRCDFRVSVFAASAGGTALWSEILTDVEIGDYNGVFTLNIGSYCITTLGGTWITDGDGGGSRCTVSGGGAVWGADDTMYLQVEFDTANTVGANAFSSPEVFARKLLSSVPTALYADNAGTVGGVAATGFVQFGPAAAQTYTGANALINLNETGGSTPNLLQLAVGGSDRFVVSNTGDITTASTGTVALWNTNVTTLNFAGAATTLNLAGGSGSTGCTINSSGDLTCTGAIAGGTGYVQIGPAAAQTYTGANALISLNETGGSTPPLINLAVGGANKFTIANSGVVTIGSEDGSNEGGHLTLAGAASYGAWNLDVYQNTTRLFTDIAGAQQVQVLNNNGGGTLSFHVAGEIRTNVGSATAPTYSFIGNTNYGMYLASSEVNTSIAGASRFRVNASGVVAPRMVLSEALGFPTANSIAYQPLLYLDRFQYITVGEGENPSLAATMYIGEILYNKSGGSASTITNAASLYIAGSPTPGGNVSATNTYALLIAAGITQLNHTRISSLGSGGNTLCINATNGRLNNCSSSLRYKRDVVDLNMGLSTVEQLRAVEFTWKEDGRRDLGFVAEEVYQINPLLTFSYNGQIEGVNYMQMSAVLVNAIKEQQTQISALQAQVTAISTQFSGTTSLYNVVANNLNVNGNLRVAGKVSVGDDTAGKATIQAGDYEVRVNFNNDYATTPVVVATAVDSQAPVVVANLSKSGFTLRLVGPASMPTADVAVNWVAVANL